MSKFFFTGICISALFFAGVFFVLTGELILVVISLIIAGVISPFAFAEIAGESIRMFTKGEIK